MALNNSHLVYAVTPSFRLPIITVVRWLMRGYITSLILLFSIDALMMGRILFKARIHVLVAVAIMSSSLFIAVQTVSFLAIMNIYDLPMIAGQGAAIRIQAALLQMLSMVVLIALISRFRKISFNIPLTKESLPIFVLPVFCHTMTFWISRITFHFPEITAIIIALEANVDNWEWGVTLGVLFFNIFVLIILETTMRNREKARIQAALEVQNNIQQTHLLQLAENQDQIRTIKHDFRQHLGVMQHLLKAQEHEQLNSYLIELLGREPSVQFVDTGNLILDALLSCKKGETLKYKINFTLEGEILPNLSYMTTELCALLGNALDNAIEACLRAEQSDTFIDLEINANENQLMCYIKNTLGVLPRTDGKFLKTQKTDTKHHGIGLRSMQQTCDALAGNLKFEYNNDYFETWIHIPGS
jgi:sensor histidine kinase YesM